MPAMPPTPCTQPGCTQYASDQGRCDQHKRKPWQKHNAKEAKKRYGAQWRKVRGAVLDRDDYQCVVCSKQGRIKAATQVDHIVPVSLDGDDSFGNLQSICTQCHNTKTAQEAAEARKGMNLS